MHPIEAFDAGQPATSDDGSVVGDDVEALARPDFLVEINAIAVVPESAAPAEHR